MKKKICAFVLMIAVFQFSANAQVKIGDNPTTILPGSLLELESTNKALTLPRLTGVQMNAIANPTNGMFIYNVDTGCVCQYRVGTLPGTARWESLCATEADSIGSSKLWPYHTNDLKVGKPGNSKGIIALPGSGQVASGAYSHAEGVNDTATGAYSWAIGNNNRSTVNYSLSFGRDNKNDASTSFLFGNNNLAPSGSYHFVSGISNTINGSGNSVFGSTNQTTSTGTSRINLINGVSNLSHNTSYSMITGNGNKDTLGYSSLIVGNSNVNKGSYSSMLGWVNTISGGYSQLVVGNLNTSISTYTAGGTILVGTNIKNTGSNNNLFGGAIDANHNSNTMFSQYDINAAANPLTSIINHQFSARFQNGYRLFTNLGMSTGAELVAGATSWSVLSDRNTKENIRNNTYGLKELMKLGTYTYNYKGNPVTQRSIGVMAQEVKEVMPELVPTLSSGNLGVNSTEIIPVLIKALQEQQSQIEELRARINRLEKN